jgi:hypothetical protein
VKFLPEDSNFGAYLAKSAGSFAGGNFQSDLKIVWGLEHQDTSGCHKTNASCTGVTVYDKTFTLGSAEVQAALKVSCKLPHYTTVLLYIGWRE